MSYPKKDYYSLKLDFLPSQQEDFWNCIEPYSVQTYLKQVYQNFESVMPTVLDIDIDVRLNSVIRPLDITFVFVVKMRDLSGLQAMEYSMSLYVVDELSSYQSPETTARRLCQELTSKLFSKVFDEKLRG